MVQVVAQPFKDTGSQFDLAHNRVATTAEHPADAPGLVAVVNDERPGVGPAQQAPTPLSLDHGLDLGRHDLVLASEACPQILRPCGLRVAAPPFAQPFIPTLPIGLTVGTVPVADAGAALSASLTPVRESFVGTVGLADSTDHQMSIARLPDMDQPCHADVLLEIANAEVPE